MPPDVGHRQGDELGKRAGTIDPDTLRGDAEMTATGEAVAAAAADHVPLSANDVAGVKVVDVGADLDNFPNKFMADGEGNLDRLLGPLVPGEDVHVGSADAGIAHADKHVVNADGGFGDILEPQAALCPALDQGLHVQSPLSNQVFILFRRRERLRRCGQDVPPVHPTVKDGGSLHGKAETGATAGWIR